jgi:Flp pilus assembly protein TadG
MIKKIRNSGIVKHAKQFLRNSSGGMAVPMALSMIPIFMATGVGIDAVRITREQAAFQAALDSATLAVSANELSATEGLTGTALTERITALETLAMKYVRANYTRETGANSNIQLGVEVTGQMVLIKATHRFPTTIMRYTGVSSIKLGFEAQVQKAMRPVEVVLVMDTTGSMAQSVTVNTPLPTGVTSASEVNTKIKGAKFAAKKFLNQLYSGTLSQKPTSQYIRVALVPFSAAVRLNQNAHDFKLDWIDTAGANPLSKLNFKQGPTPPTTWNNYTAWSQIKSNSSTYHGWNGCVETRRSDVGDLHIDDTAPRSSDGDTLFPAYFAPDASGTDVETNDFGVSYIGGDSLSNTGSECKGLTSCNTDTDKFTRKQQENYNKYVDKVLPSTGSGPWYNCAATAIVPMSYDRSKVEAGIDAMSPAGSTVIPEGLSWGFRVISPTEPFTRVEAYGTNGEADIAPYDSQRWFKVVLLMTDGNNDVGPGTFEKNSSWYSSYGFAGEALATNRYGTTDAATVESNLNSFTLDACNKIKAKNDAGRSNMILYVSSFGDGVSTDTKNMLRSCATSPAHYMHATTANDLVAAFDHFGQDTLNKMVYISK